MKLIRLTDDRYVLDAGPDITPAQLDAIGQYWKEWWAKNPGATPEAIVLGGGIGPLEYEDRRTSDLEGRVQRLEEHTHIDKHEPPVGGIEQFQAEDR